MKAVGRVGNGGQSPGLLLRAEVLLCLLASWAAPARAQPAAQPSEYQVKDGRRLAVIRVEQAPAPKTCQVLFISASEKDIARLTALTGRWVLTVADPSIFQSKNDPEIEF
ncbi:MAG TPA: YfiR/HmsC family protein [Bryobacteraceae bacterium]|nr:YfiR/HmsC family protein [Bryobacteraceae bacterium]